MQVPEARPKHALLDVDTILDIEDVVALVRELRFAGERGDSGGWGVMPACGSRLVWPTRLYAPFSRVGRPGRGSRGRPAREDVSGGIDDG